MFDNIGGKIKRLATIICVVGMIASLIAAIGLWAQHDQYNSLTRTYSNTIWDGICVLLGGCIGSWTGCFCLYGFGQLIEDTALNRQISQSILETMKKQNTDSSWEEAGYDEPIDFSQEGIAQSAIGTAEFVKRRTVWECAECGTKNDGFAIMCKDCGAYK